MQAKPPAKLHQNNNAWRDQIQDLPNASREDAEGLRRDLSKQLQALERLNKLADESNNPSQPQPTGTTSLSGAYEGATRNAQSQRPGQQRSMSSGSTYPPRRNQQPGRVGNEGDRWSVGDLLARASQDDQRAATVSSSRGAMGDDFKLDIQAMANALDANTAATIWARLRSGQTDVMSRSFYSQNGQVLFDQFADRLRTDVGLQQTVDRFLGDFDRIRRDTDANDPTGSMGQSQLLSDTGRVYLFLAHARGRLR